MKTNLALTILVFFILTGCKTSNNLIIRTASSDVLYIGVDNPMLLTGHGLKKSNITIDNGVIVSVDSVPNDTSRMYYIRADNSNPTYLKIKNGSSTTTFKYRKKLIPNPEIVLASDSGRINSGQVSIYKIQTAKGLVAIINSFDYNCAIQILGYELTTIKNNSVTESVYKNNLTPRFQNINSGDIFIFHDIIIEFQGNKEQRIVNGPTIIVSSK